MCAGDDQEDGGILRECQEEGASVLTTQDPLDIPSPLAQLSPSRGSTGWGGMIVSTGRWAEPGLGPRYM